MSAASAYPSAKGSTPASTCRRVLAVEDEVLIAVDIQSRLENSGYEVIGIAANSNFDRACSSVPFGADPWVGSCPA